MLAGLVAVAAAQEPPELRWEPVLEVRERFTAEGPPGALAAEVGQRARVGMQVTRANVSARVSFEEVRSWVEVPAGVVPQGFEPRIAEGWGAVGWDFSRNVGVEVTVGRQALQLDEGRLLGRDDVPLQGRFLDALRVEARGRPFEVEFVNARRFEEDALGLGVTALRAGVHVHQPLTVVAVDAVGLVDARDTARTTSTAGLYARVDSGRARARSETYVQGSAAGLGSLVALSAGWVLGPNERLTLSGRYDVASARVSDTTAAWRPVLGDSRRFWGVAGRFDDVEAVTAGRGLADAHAVAEWRPSARLAGTAALHRFWSPFDGAPYGWEGDATVAWAFSPYGGVELGAARFAGDGAWEDTTFGWLELHVAF